MPAFQARATDTDTDIPHNPQSVEEWQEVAVWEVKAQGHMARERQAEPSLPCCRTRLLSTLQTMENKE